MSSVCLSVCLSVCQVNLCVRDPYGGTCNVIITYFYHAMNFYFIALAYSRTSFSLSVTHDAQSSMNHTRKCKGSIYAVCRIVRSFVRSFVARSFVRSDHVSTDFMKLNGQPGKARETISAPIAGEHPRLEEV